MEFIPDIIVNERGWRRRLLVVGVDDDKADLAARADEIKAYMERSNVQEGLAMWHRHSCLCCF